MSTLSDAEREELSLLLPWYANGTLDSEAERRVEAALVADTDLAREFDLILEDQAAVIDLVSEEEVPQSIGERFKAALNAELAEPAIPTTPRVSEPSVLERLVSMLFPAQPRAYAAVAAVVALLLPAVAIVSYQAGNQSPATYQTATGEEEPAAAGTRVLVKVAPTAAWTDIDAFLRENSGQIVKGPSADGLYELEFEQAEGVADKLSEVPGLFEFALPVN